MTNMEKILERIVVLTRSGQVEWNNTSPGTYSAKIREMSATIKLVHLATADGDTLSSVGVTVTIGRISMTFFEGSRCMTLVHEILTAGDDPWRRHTDTASKAWAEIANAIEADQEDNL